MRDFQLKDFSRFSTLKTWVRWSAKERRNPFSIFRYVYWCFCVKTTMTIEMKRKGRNVCENIYISNRMMIIIKSGFHDKIYVVSRLFCLIRISPSIFIFSTHLLFLAHSLRKQIPIGMKYANNVVWPEVVWKFFPLRFQFKLERRSSSRRWRRNMFSSSKTSSSLFYSFFWTTLYQIWKIWFI